ASGRLSGRYVRVHNAGWINTPSPQNTGVVATPLGDARPDAAGDFVFEHGRGGTRVDKYPLRSAKYPARYESAARFGEVKAYHHLARIAAYVGGLLLELGELPLPPVVARVHAHHAAVQRGETRDGEWMEDHWAPFQGAHYRLPSLQNTIREFEPV